MKPVDGDRPGTSVESSVADGFSLIELLVVVTVLGILAAMVVFGVANITDDSATSACKADLRSMYNAVTTYKEQVGRHPDDVSDLTGTTVDAVGAELGPWLRTAPLNPGRYSMAVGGGDGAAPPGTAASHPLGTVVLSSTGADPATGTDFVEAASASTCP